MRECGRYIASRLTIKRFDLVDALHLEGPLLDTFRWFSEEHLLVDIAFHKSWKSQCAIEITEDVVIVMFCQQCRADATPKGFTLSDRNQWNDNQYCMPISYFGSLITQEKQCKCRNNRLWHVLFSTLSTVSVI
jgi:hypothetical protein